MMCIDMDIDIDTWGWLYGIFLWGEYSSYALSDYLLLFVLSAIQSCLGINPIFECYTCF